MDRQRGWGGGGLIVLISALQSIYYKNYSIVYLK